jgi:hypothetical protein
MAGTIVADNIQAASSSTLVLKNGVANTPPTIQDSSGTQIGTFCRAWVNFNGTGTVAIRSSFNVSSITDNGTGDYTVNFTTAMPDVNYAASLSCVQRQTASTTNQSVGYYSTDDVNATTYSTTAVRISNKIGSVTGFNDVNIVSVAIFR